MRTVFMGSPDFSVPSLKALAHHYNVVAVVTQPDRRAGRGQKRSVCPVKQAAQALAIPVLQPSKLRTPEAVAEVHAFEADLIIVVAYGQILPASILEQPRFGCINVHASLLPRWRGASPIQAAIRAGDDQTGITIMKMDEGLDTGPVLQQTVFPIAENITGGELSVALADLGAAALLETLPPYLAGTLTPRPQPEGHTYAPLLKKADGELDFSLSAEELARQVRAYQPWPGTYFFLDGRRIAVRAVERGTAQPLPPGETVVVDGYPAVSTSSGVLILREIQPAGKKTMHGPDFLRGVKSFAGKSVEKRT